MNRVSTFLRKRSQIEEEYARKLIKLTDGEMKKEVPCSISNLKTFDVFTRVVAETRRHASVTESLAGRMLTQVVKPLANERKNQKSQRSILVADTLADRKRVSDAETALNKELEKYHEACRAAYTDMSAYRKSAADPNVKPSVSMKLGDRMKKSKEAARKQELEYREMMAKFNDIQRRFWVDTLPFSLEQLQVLEENRIREMNVAYDTYLALLTEQRDSLALHCDTVSHEHIPHPPPKEKELEIIIHSLRTGKPRPSDQVFQEGVDYQDRESGRPTSHSVSGAMTESSSNGFDGAGSSSSGSASKIAMGAAAGVAVGGAVGVAAASNRSRAATSAAVVSPASSSTSKESSGQASDVPISAYIENLRSEFTQEELARRTGDFSPSKGLFAIMHSQWAPSPVS